MAFQVFCYHSDSELCRRLVAEVERFGGGLLAVEVLGGEWPPMLRRTDCEGGPLLVLAGGEHADDWLARFRKTPEFATIGGIRIGEDGRAGDWDARLAACFRADELTDTMRRVLTDHVLLHAPEQATELARLLDPEKLAGAWRDENKHRLLAESRLRELQDSLLGSGDISDADAELALIAEADRLFGHPPRDSHEDGEILFHEGRAADGLRAVLVGRVELFRTIGGEDVSFFTETRGHPVGLMSLSRGGPAFFSCRAIGHVEVLHLTRRQLRDAVMASPRFAALLVTVILRSHGRRNRHASRLLFKVRSLNRSLVARRDQLELALAELEAAQLKLVEAGKMATLGNLAAGMAHELNNPSAALLRAAECLREDMGILLGGAQGSPLAFESMKLGYGRPPLSTRDERESRRKMMEYLGDDQSLASALVSSGITDVETLEGLLSSSHGTDRTHALAVIAQGGRAGAALRAIESCSRRIAGLTGSLKMYARADDGWIGDIDINSTLEDVLLVLGHRLRGIEVRKEYGNPPAVRCIPSQIEQVWTNLIVNACQAMGGRGVMQIRTRAGAPGFVRVEVEDSGPGIPDEIQSRVFDARFTTKGGRVEFGLGLGLPICQSIVARHGGRIGFTSVPGRTIFHVELPVILPDPPTP